MSEAEGSQINSEFNGLYFCDIFIAKELVALILTQVDYKSLIANCRLVCKQWNSIISDSLLWKRKTESEKRKWPSLPRDCNIPWSFYASVYIYNPVDRNLIRNSNGKYRLQHWTVLSKAGDGFAFEQPPVGSDDVPLEAENDCKLVENDCKLVENDCKLVENDCKLVENACFATSYHSCSKEQIIDLSALGFFPDVLKQCKPKIYCKDWYAGRFDCGCVYECTFSLLDEAKNVIDDFQFRTSINQWEGREWHKVEHCFNEYPESVRYLKFYHGGTDRQFWAGHYGAKMTGASVVVSFT